MNEQLQENLLDDLQVNLELASKGKRFANYLIDLVVFYIVLTILVVAYIFLNPNELDSVDDASLSVNIIERIIWLIVYGIFMGCYEALGKGVTLGKLITKTKAVNEDGSKITTKTAFLRGLSRAVPFDAFSALGDPSYPWHDKWTKTYVIDIQKSTLA